MIFRKIFRLTLLVLLLSGLVPVNAQEAGGYATYDQNLFIDTDWYRENMIIAADRWNGGLDGESGLGVYQADFTGFFHVNLDRQWRQQPLEFSTSVAQSRGIYMNVEAYRAAGVENGARFLKAVNQGVEVLLTQFHDPEFGGFYWAVSPTGKVVDSMKQGYGNVHPIFALAQAYGVTQNPEYLNAALEQLDVYRTHFLNPNYACGVHPGFSRDFSEIIGVNNIDTFTHFFEALLALHDVTEGDIQAEIDALIVTCGDFLVNFLYHDQEGFMDRGYVAYNYDDAWQPSQIPYTRELQWSGALQATPGHNIELAYLLSRAVERGFDSEWLLTSAKLIKFCLEYALHPDYGGMIYDITDYDGQPLAGNPDNDLFIWWAQAETARALLHFIVVRGYAEYREPFKQVETLFHSKQTDQEYGGLYPTISAVDNLRPAESYKGNIWKVNYHYTMFFTEVLRLQAVYPDEIAAVNAVKVD